MSILADNTFSHYTTWFLKMAIIGSIPGAICWIAYAALGGFVQTGN